MLPSLLYLFVIDYLLLKCSSVGMLGPADMIMKSSGVCEADSNEFIFKLATRKYNRTIHVLDIDVDTPYPIDSNIILELKSYIKKDGGYKPGQFYMKDSFCVVLKTLLGDLFDTFLQMAGTDDCPIPEGTYVIHDFYIDNSKFTVPHVYGDYKTEALFYKDDVLIRCLFALVEVVPKNQW